MGGIAETAILADDDTDILRRCLAADLHGTVEALGERFLDEDVLASDDGLHALFGM
jgi:hypothetical protein